VIRPDEGSQNDFPLLPVTELEDLILRDGACPVLTVQVTVQGIRKASERGVYGAGGCCASAEGIQLQHTP
jgi:hypothetical protein